ncbi:hypothetical protein [Amycolatopsis plumensis]|uniref:Bacterial Ig domain-containing protein n=1 Tax=Amycolatopsis plumensis TaxID=236508 RepID=A0ABV5U8F5_9PSEU
MAELDPGLNIRLAADRPGGGSTFVELEDDHGNSVRIGKATTDLDGTWSIRITADDLAGLPAPKQCEARTPTRWKWPCVHRAGHDSAHRALIPGGTYSWHDPHPALEDR